MINAAIKQGWDIPRELMTQLPSVMSDIIFDERVDPKIKISAAKVIVSMHGQNQKDSPVVSITDHQHSVRFDPVVANTLEDRKRQIASRIAGGCGD